VSPEGRKPPDVGNLDAAVLGVPRAGPGVVHVQMLLGQVHLGHPVQYVADRGLVEGRPARRGGDPMREE
jgi:hypothetical protein